MKSIDPLNSIREVVLVLLGLVFTSWIFAQERQRQWSEGPLQWNEFKEELSAQKNESLAFYLGFKHNREKRADSVFVRLNTYAYLDVDQAVVRPIDKMGPNLMYHQVIFDMAEYYRRTMQMRIDQTESIFEAKAVFEELYEDFESDAKNFIKQTNSGEKLGELSKWRKLVTDTLKATPSVKYPTFYKRDFGIGIYGGLGTSIQTGNLSKQYSIPLMLGFGFDIGFRDMLLYLNGSLGFNRSLSDDLTGQNRFKQGSVEVAIIDVSVGYAVVDVNKWKLAPFLGVGVTEYTQSTDSELDEYSPLSSFNIVFGLFTDYKVRKRVKIVPVNAKEITDSSIRLRLFATPVRLDSDLTGMTINLGIAYCGFARMIGMGRR